MRGDPEKILCPQQAKSVFCFPVALGKASFMLRTRERFFLSCDAGPE
jgi:hypothetical protein